MYRKCAFPETAFSMVEVYSLTSLKALSLKLLNCFLFSRAVDEGYSEKNYTHRRLPIQTNSLGIVQVVELC